MSVYFITCREVGRVKIGCANDPWDRLEKLRTSSPCYAEERQLHRRFAEFRVRFEWFAIVPEIEVLIAASSAPVRGFEGLGGSQRRKLQHNLADNETIAAKRLRERELETESSSKSRSRSSGRCSRRRWRISPNWKPRELKFSPFALSGVGSGTVMERSKLDARPAVAETRGNGFDHPAPLPSIAWGKCAAPLPSVAWGRR